MKILEKYTGSKTYMYPNGALATVASVTEKFPAWQSFVHVVETDENGDIDATLAEDDAIAAIQEIINTPPAEPAPSAEERIAAALEYQALNSLPDAQ